MQSPFEGSCALCGEPGSPERPLTCALWPLGDDDDHCMPLHTLCCNTLMHGEGGTLLSLLTGGVSADEVGDPIWLQSLENVIAWHRRNCEFCADFRRRQRADRKAAREAKAAAKKPPTKVTKASKAQVTKAQVTKAQVTKAKATPPARTATKSTTRTTKVTAKATKAAPAKRATRPVK